MTRPSRALMLALALLLAAPSAASATVLATGTLTNAAGAPSAGEVRVYAWVFPKLGQTREMPLLGTATAGSDGRFSVASLNDGLLRSVSGPRDGWVDFTVVGSAGSDIGSWGYTGFVDAPGGTARISTADAVIDSGGKARVANAEPRIPELRVRLQHRTPVASASQVQECDWKRHVKAVGSMRKMTVVGEVNNSYNDGSYGTFTYGSDGFTESTIGAASNVKDVGWSIDAEYLIKQEGRVRFAPAKRRYSRKLRTSFEYTKYEIRASECAEPEEHVRATAWIGDSDDSIKQNGLDKCDAKYFNGQNSHDQFFRKDTQAVTYTRAVEAFGINLTSRSGYSKSVTIKYDWRGPENKKHYICGEDGKSSAYSSPRILTGSRK